MQNPCPQIFRGLAAVVILAAGQAQGAQIEFVGSEGYADGPLSNSVDWVSGEDGANIVDIASLF